MTEHYVDLLDTPTHDEATEADGDEQRAEAAGEDQR